MRSEETSRIREAEVQVAHLRTLRERCVLLRLHRLLTSTANDRFPRITRDELFQFFIADVSDA